MRNKSLFFFFELIFLMGMVSAVPPFADTSFSEGLTIQIPQDNILDANQNYTFDFHVFNTTTGVPIVSNIACEFHYYNDLGEHLFEDINSIADGVDYEFELDAGNFSIGTYYYFINCNNSNIGGFATSIVRVYMGGEEPTTAKSIIYAILFLSCLVFLTLSLYGAVSLDGKNEYQMGKIMSINFNKYIKQGLFFISYLFLIFTTFLASEISQNQLQLANASVVLNWVHLVLWIALLPIFIVFVTFSLIKWLADLNLMDLGKRNLREYGT